MVDRLLSDLLALFHLPVKTPSSNDNVAVSTVSDKLAKKARKLGMNSEMRRSIFYILATCDVSVLFRLIHFSCFSVCSFR